MQEHSKGRNSRGITHGIRGTGINMKKEKSIIFVYLLIYLVAALTIAINQPLYDSPPLFGNPPDEHSRYMVPLYICEHGTLPTGFEEELFSGGCKWTYGFYTLLPYMVQGYAMRFVNLFTDSSLALLYTARFVNVLFGLFLAIMVIKISKKLFKQEPMRWLFCFLITFWPQSLFLHTYVNPDSLCLLSTALMIYGLLCGYEDGFSFKSSAYMTAGIVLCTLSYYNAYGYIVACVLLFTAYFLNKKEGKWCFDWKPFLKKGCLIAAVVILLAGWSFVRNYILYDGDFIGLDTKEEFIKSFGISRETFASRGESLFAMLFGTTFLPKMIISFIANFGSGTIYAFLPLYGLYLGLIALGVLGLVFVLLKKDSAKDTTKSAQNDTTEKSQAKWKQVFFHLNMIFCIVMPFILLVKYAYSVDYQAQGRYIMPGLIPMMYYVCMGLGALPFVKKLSDKKQTLLCALVFGALVAALFIIIFMNALPVYQQTKVL